ncbi:MAG: hypothetical protein UR43_C0032G0008 [candidate division TM6 bacterium GW2011_GWF2_33_332]|nr:MAG: hypothetical protein UR43_C0032G0008 [candidate division TM6 bacterium GW2011_GWF2_33_332]
MTDNQKNLIIFIHKYRLENGSIPSLIEMVDGIGVSDNKSVLRAIDSLTKQEYLAKIGKKLSSVIPTDRALKELRLFLLQQDTSKPYQFINDTSKLKVPDDISRNNVATSSSSYIGPLGGNIKSDGTRLDSNELKTIVQSAVNIALSGSTQHQGTLSDIMKRIPLNKESEWCFLAITLLGFAVLFFGKDILAIFATCGILFTIFIITNISK